MRRPLHFNRAGGQAPNVAIRIAIDVLAFDLLAPSYMSEPRACIQGACLHPAATEGTWVSAIVAGMVVVLRGGLRVGLGHLMQLPAAISVLPQHHDAVVV